MACITHTRARAAHTYTHTYTHIHTMPHLEFGAIGKAVPTAARIGRCVEHPAAAPLLVTRTHARILYIYIVQ